MPDWFSHILIAWIPCQIFKLDREKRVLVYIGALVPDIGKLFMVVDMFSSSSSHWFFEPFHSLLIPILVAGVLAQFFQKPKTAFALIGVGALSHMFADMMLYNLAGGYYLLFPSTMQIPNFEIFPSATVWLNVFVLILAGPFIYLELVKPLLTRKNLKNAI